MNRMVHDGTPCSYDDPYSVCFQGECEVFIYIFNFLRFKGLCILPKYYIAWKLYCNRINEDTIQILETVCLKRLMIQRPIFKNIQTNVETPKAG